MLISWLSVDPLHLLENKTTTPAEGTVRWKKGSGFSQLFLCLDERPWTCCDYDSRFLRFWIRNKTILGRENYMASTVKVRYVYEDRIQQMNPTAKCCILIHHCKYRILLNGMYAPTGCKKNSGKKRSTVRTCYQVVTIRSSPQFYPAQILPNADSFSCRCSRVLVIPTTLLLLHFKLWEEVKLC